MVAKSLWLLAVSGSAVLAAGTPGCGKDHHLGYNNNSGDGFSIQSGGKDRTYTINIPSSYDPNTAAGLILSYHGNGKDSANEYYLSEFYNEDWNPDYISVYPQGYDGHWQSANYSDSDDLQFTSDLLGHLKDNYCVDESRIYANGKSNGGGFIGLLMCSPQGADFAAFAMCSGAFYSDNGSQPCSAPRTEMPVLEFHGSDDQTIYYDGAEEHGGVTSSIPAWIGRWADRNKCDTDHVHHDFSHDDQLNHTYYDCGDAGNAVQQYWIEGMGHDWPSTQPNSDNPDGGTIIDATPIIMDFFRNCTLPQS